MQTLPTFTLVAVLTLIGIGRVASEENYGAVSTLSALDAGIAQKNAAIAAHRDESCGNVEKLLELMFDVDQFARSSLGQICPTWEKNCLMTAWPRVMAIDDTNLKILKPIIARYNWHELKACGGKEAQLHAWLLVQHADRDLPFQHAVLEKMREAFLAGEVSATDYAYLVDRVAMGEKKPQTFGTQGGCDGDAWKPIPLLAPESLDQRRHEVGLESELAYASRNTDLYCKPQPSTPRP